MFLVNENEDSTYQIFGMLQEQCFYTIQKNKLKMDKRLKYNL